MFIEFPNATSRDYFELFIPNTFRSQFKSIDHRPTLLMYNAKQFPDELQELLKKYDGKIVSGSNGNP